MVLDYLFNGSPLYITPEQSLYALKVADATYRAATTGLTVFLKD
jgi:biliverdin reductase